MERLMPHERYRSDPVFAALVDQIHYQICEGTFTPTELREACHLAACMYEERHIRPILVDPSRPFEWVMKRP